MLRDLITNFSIITIFVLFVEQFFIRKNTDTKPIWLHKVYVGVAHGILVNCLMLFSVQMDEHVSLNFRGVGLLLSAYLGGTLSLVITFVLLWTGRLWIEGGIQIPQLLIGLVALLGTSYMFAKTRSYWLKWLYGGAFFYVFYYAVIWLLYGTSLKIIGIYIFYQSCCLFLIALYLKYLLRTRNYKHMVYQMEREMIGMLRLQPGFTFKFQKHRDDYVYVLIEGQLLEQLGLIPNDFIGKRTDEVAFYSETLAVFLKERYAQAWEGERITYEALYGSYNVLVTLQPILQDGEVIEVIGSAVDMTEHKAAEFKIREREEQYRTLVENSDDFILGFDAKGIVTSVNQKLCQTLQLRSDQLVGRPFAPMLTLDDADLWEQAFEHTIALHKAQRFEMSMILPDDSESTFNVTLSPFYSVTEEIAGVIATIHDITDLKKREEADEANWAKSQFLARMSHEIRTPLNGIIGLSLLMQKTELSDIQKDYLNKIESSSNALLGTINDILDFSKIEAGKITLEKVDFSLEESLRRVADLSSFSFGKKQIDMIIETSDDLPHFVNGDAFRLEQVLINLANNAIKFTEHGYIRICVGLEAYMEEHVLISFAIEDTGIGLSREQLSKLFSPFTQADSSTSRKYGGTGLGLVICQHLIQSMGGILKVDSKRGEGSRFYFNVMFEQSRQEAAGEQELVQFAEGNHHVLLAEDHPLVREHLANTLQAFQLQVKTVSSASELCEVLDGTHANGYPEVDFLIVDMEIDQMKEPPVWNRVMSTLNRDKTRVVAVTTVFGREEMEHFPYELRADAVLMKPISRLNLHQTLHMLIQNENRNAQQPIQLDQKSTSAQADPKGYILVAEDNEINQLVISHLLEQLGYHVTMAKNGHEVLEQIDQHTWTLVLMDLHMPDMDGYEATKKLRQNKRYNRIPIVTLTANVLMQDIDRCLKLGMNDILIKPVDDVRLEQMINKWKNLKWLYEIKGIDTAQVLKNVDDKIHIFQYMVNKFKQDYSSFSAQVNTALDQQEIALVRRMVHTLRGIAANFYAESLLEIVRMLDTELELANNEKNMDRWRQSAAKIQVEIDRIIHAVEMI
nr:response regulator [Paenibacillus sp. SYP-B3998]